ncbi:MAG TPA: 6-carboxytetrahydropterin synthase, partial [Candidatus Margulisiibacteriota bacterium]|nr:6-carboxytetrahydropterin synthase [Candidatus Margulisiibacteriota bacterium]
KGKCEELHGHNWRVEMVVSQEGLDKTGMVEDFTYLKKILKSQLEKLDHKYLNKLPYFQKVNPTSENIARYIFDALKLKLLNIKSVTVWENNNSCATYEE